VDDGPAVILVADDTETQRYILATWLRRAGHTVIEAATGRDALARLDGVDLVVLDVRMPDLSGIDVCERIKADPRTAVLPVIQVSAAAVEVRDRAHGLRHGADAYLANPVEPDEFLATVTAALRYYRARRRAERTAARLAALTEVTLAINAAETVDRLGRAAVAGAVEIFEAAAAIIMVLPDGQLHRFALSPADQAPVEYGGHVDLVETLAGRLLVTDARNGTVIVSADEWRRLVPDAILTGDVCLAAFRTKPSRPPVALAVDAGGILGEDERQILRQLTQSVALAVEALRAYADEHLIALTLQRSFLSSARPEMPGLELAVRYRPASDQAEVGGDFYELLAWQNQLLAVIGDVEGHSLQAATVMGELRHAIRAFAAEGHPPTTIARLLNNVLRRYHPNFIATICLLLLDPATGEFQVVNCGHIPPLVFDGETAAYGGEGGVLLGARLHHPLVEHGVLPAGGVILMVTDGLIEDRHGGLIGNMEQLRVMAENVGDDDLETVSDSILARFGMREDDVALVAIRRTGTVTT
jgi:serine phosphatase RsbU (regulator of sigma subunit)/CheY-like chemotaxis protein